MQNIEVYDVDDITKGPKKDRIKEFLMTYGWVLLVAIFFLGLLVYFFVSANNDKTIDTIEEAVDYMELLGQANMTCENLEFVVNGTLFIYPEIVNTKAQIEEATNMRVIEINGETSKVKFNNSLGVTCEIEAELCRLDYLYCVDIGMVVPVNYTLYEIWRRN